jgi:hypothetical protein
MSDYISREALIGKVEKHYCAPCKGQGGDLGGDWCRSCVINSVLEKVRGIPAAAFTGMFHIVRCRDCIHRQGDENPLCMLHTEPYANARGYKGEAVCVEMNDFCSYGERRKSNENNA